MDIRDKIITGTFAIGSDGRKEPTDWKDYAIKLEHMIPNGNKELKKIDYSRGCSRFNIDTCDCDLQANECKHRDYKEYQLEKRLQENRVWKSVEFERPEVGVIVCIMLKGSDICHTGFRANGGWYLFNLHSKVWIPNDEKSGVKITHWQELPNTRHG